MAITVDIYTRNMELTDLVRDYIEKKAAKLDRFLSNIEETRVDLDYIRSARNAADRMIAQITIRGKGYILRSEESATDIYTAIDAAMEKIQRRIERYKGKRQHGRGDGTPASEVVPGESVEEAQTEPVIARRKQFELVPMDEMEAIEQMSLLGHDNFFIFYNIETSTINILYRRTDGSFGLIEPRIG